MLSNTRVSELKEEHVDKATQLIVNAMLSAQSQLDQPQLTSQVRNCIISCLSSNWSFVLLKDSQVVGAVIQKQMKDIQQSFDIVNLSAASKGDIIYSIFTAIDPTIKNHVAICFLWDIMARCKAAGWKYGYMRVLDHSTYDSITKLGAQEVQSIPKDQFRVLKMHYSQNLLSISNLRPLLITSKL